MSEKVSRLVDGELPESEIASAVGELTAHRGSAKRWRNYHLIGIAMRGEAALAERDLGVRIARRLEQEPTVLAPGALTGRAGRDDADAWKPVAMFAVAASLALVAVLTLVPDAGTAGQQRPAARLAQPADGRLAQEFDAMLAEHGEFTATPGLNGLIAYAKLVSSQNLEQ